MSRVWVFCLLCWLICLFLFFFFQAEDGIRDLTVTGVQTCALPILIVARGAGDEQQLAFLDLALEERLTRPGTLERATAAVVAEDRPEYPESLAGGEHPRAHDAADARRLLAHLHLVQERDRRGVEIPMGGVVQQVPDAPDTEPCERLRT